MTARALDSIVQGDCLEVMKGMEAGSIDAVITDLPYGTTACSWDEIIPFAPMWEQVNRINKGAFVTTASQPFTSKLIMSNIEQFRYEWIWKKNKATGHLDARRRPLKEHENLIVFGNTSVYNPQLGKGIKYKNNHKPGDTGEVYGEVKKYSFDNQGTRFPRSVLEFMHETDPNHPTQKPVALYEYLIQTYTNPSDTVLDICCGSGTTLVAAKQLGRHYIGIDISEKYCEIARKRVAGANVPLPLFT